jgi:alpha-beta hydrolase superfamily lysophospholipase
VHGFSEDSDRWLELAYQLALNGILVHMVDLEGYGFSAGVRGMGPSIPNCHYNITALLEQFKPGVPSFLYGNSMGCMVINTYLLQNSKLPIAGVIFGSPFFELTERVHFDAPKKFAVKALKDLLEVS